MTVPLPSPSSIVHRESIARLLTPLRRIRPTVAYYRLAAHRVPTLWTLYRGLQRHAERENIKWRVRTLFEAKRHTIQAHVAKGQLERAYQWLDVFVRAKQGDGHLRAVLDRYDRMIGSKRERRQFGRLVREALGSKLTMLYLQSRQDEQARLHTRTIFKGSFVRPTLYNRLLPRLVPQPVSIACMIHKRRLRRERQHEEFVRLAEWVQDIEMECAFEKQLRRAGEHVRPVFSDDLNAWLRPLRNKLQVLQRASKREYDRLYSEYSPRLLLRGLEARRRKIRYRTRQHVRERAGEVFSSTVARMRQGPPAHVLAKMTPEERREDRIARTASESGYAAMVKMNLGRKLKDGETWRTEDGKEEDWERLERLQEEVREETMRRRSAQVDGAVGWGRS